MHVVHIKEVVHIIELMHKIDNKDYKELMHEILDMEGIDNID